MATVDRYDTAMDIFFKRQMRQFHTSIRAKVVAVNYAGPTVDVQPMAFTEFPSGTIDRYSTIYDVPVQLPSGSGGKSRLTMPIKVGDYVGVTFSERNEDDNSDMQTHGMFPGWAVTQVFTDANAKPIDPDNVVLENDKAIVTLKPNGDMVMSNPKVTIESLANGNVKITNGTGTFTISPSGEIKGTNGPGSFSLDPSGQMNINGAKVTTSGNMITAGGVDLEDFYRDYLAHRHTGVESGPDITGTKV